MMCSHYSAGSYYHHLKAVWTLRDDLMVLVQHSVEQPPQHKKSVMDINFLTNVRRKTKDWTDLETDFPNGGVLRSDLGHADQGLVKEACTAIALSASVSHLMEDIGLYSYSVEWFMSTT